MSIQQEQRTQDQLIDVTQAAAAKLQEAVNKAMQDASAEQSSDYGIRLGVTGGGCAGLQYDLKPVSQADENDIIAEYYGVKFYIHPMVLPYLKGTRLDFSDSLMDGGFKFSNPNATSSCGCGTSFGI